MATKSEIETEVLGRIYRTADETPLLATWLRRAIKKIEDAYPFGYLRRTSTIALNPIQQSEYSLPANLIVHHPFLLKIESIQDDDTFTPIIKVRDTVMEYIFTEPKAVTGNPSYYAIKGDGNMSKFQLYAIPDKSYDAHFYGHYYTDTSSWGPTSSNYLTDKYPDLVIEAVVQMASEYFSEFDRADRAYQRYLIYLNGDPTRQGVSGAIQDEKKSQLSGRHLKARLAYSDKYAYQRRNIIGK